MKSMEKTVLLKHERRKENEYKLTPALMMTEMRPMDLKKSRLLQRKQDDTAKNKELAERFSNQKI